MTISLKVAAEEKIMLRRLAEKYEVSLSEFMYNLVLFDREVRDATQKALQKSIAKTVEKENYEWITMQVSEDGSVEYK